MTYTNHPDALFDPGAPILGATGLEARDNLVAVAAGDDSADTAPRVQGKALGGISIGTSSTTGTSGDNFTGLDGHGLILINVIVENGANPNLLRVRFSNDDGTSWGSWQNTFVAATSTVSSGSIRVNMQTGEAYYQMAGGTTSMASSTLSLTVPTDANAISISWSLGVTAAAFDLLALGGIE